MTRLTVQSGDFLQGEGEFRNGSLTLKTCRSPNPGEKIALTRIRDLIVANQESSRSLGSTLGWGVAGALVAGPVGLIAGLWLGGKEEEVTFLATFKDGRKLMAITDGKTWSKINGQWRRQVLPAANR
ncbi:hypothetical protein KC131_10720 [Pseudomonas sp. JQ170]|uniref:hypothetical protein n=1 Tax=unclassified Pseudomonas TaxID=196821 RepID=UPI0026509965|nr:MULTISPECIES: hypothetical protein [unclassified Pseudomonas]MDN7141123.1 hypothetical protein [Pseudomonas sp. JQ170]WRO74783.1 hypothetical protein U9R80_20080 [Pseudomonas sp. 170C]